MIVIEDRNYRNTYLCFKIISFISEARKCRILNEPELGVSSWLRQSPEQLLDLPAGH